MTGTEVFTWNADRARLFYPACTTSTSGCCTDSVKLLLGSAELKVWLGWLLPSSGSVRTDRTALKVKDRASDFLHVKHALRAAEWLCTEEQ